MLRCKDVARRASALIDGDLSSWEALQMRMHLAICKGCTAFVGQMRTTAALSDMAANPASDSDTDTVRIEAILSDVHNHRKPGK
ncbi:anti-sigma factor RsiW [Roseovarius sp. MBR-78]|jgi:anti-sigma factor RsiW|uniref:zf-HC2 domain-containing protein n=1 Tax=Roseovarius sp. MBR-78 TaxID=3156460 RepID=UPI00339B9B22